MKSNKKILIVIYF